MRIFPLQVVSSPATVPTLLLGIYSCVVAVVFYQLTSAWPHAGNWKQFILVLVCPGIAINLFKLLGPKVRSRTRRVLERLLSIIIGSNHCG